VVLGAAAIVGWFGASVLLAESLSDAFRATGDLARRLTPRGRADGVEAAASAVFVSYRTAEHGRDARAVSEGLQAAGQPAWLDAERGTLPT
jgi:hypothetical protein